MNKADEATEKKLRSIEKKIRKYYKRAFRAIGKDWGNYLIKISKEIDDLQKEYEKAKESGIKEDIKKTGKKLGQIKREKTLMNKRYRDLTEETARAISNSNKIALSYINDELPEIYAINYNSFKEQTEYIKGYSFSLVDAATVKNLSMNDDTLLPYKKIDEKKDVRWNTKKMNAEILEAILSGESINKTAKRLQKVFDMNEESAIRNARTATTSAENKGRFDSYHNALEDGMIIKKEWLSSNGIRTRHSHRNAPEGVGGEVVEIDEPFSNGLMYPGDPNGDPSEVYGCRCTMRAKIIGFKKVRK